MRRKFLWGTAVLYSLLHFAFTGVLQPLRNFYGDFLASFPSWKIAQLTGRLDLYRGSLSERWGPPPIWHYGPVEHIITLPLFAFSSLRTAYVAWLIVNYVFVAAAAIIAAWIIDDGRPSARTSLIVGIGFANFNPLFEALTQRTIEVFELPILLLAFLLYRKMRDRGTGTLLGIAAMSKFLPLVFLPWLALRKRWRAFVAAVVVILSIVIVTQYALGWQNSGIILQLIHGVHVDTDTNQSISGLLIRLTSWSQEEIAVATLAICVACWNALWSLFFPRTTSHCDDFEFSILTLAMVLLIPHNEQYYFVLLLIPYTLMYARYRAKWNRRLLPLILSFVTIAAPVPLSLLARVTGLNVMQLYLHWCIPLAGAVILGFFLAREYGTSCAV